METGKFRLKSKEPNHKPTYDRISSEEPDAERTIIQKKFQFPQIVAPTPGTAARTGAMAATVTFIALILSLAAVNYIKMEKKYYYKTYLEVVRIFH